MSVPKHVLLPWLGIALVMGMLAAFVWVKSRPSDEPVTRATIDPRPKRSTAATRQPVTAEQVTAANVQRLVQRWTQAQIAHERERVFDTVRDDKERLGPAILELLVAPGTQQTVAAIWIAVEMEMAEAVPALTHLAVNGIPEVRAAAILAVERLSPWDKVDLGRLFADEDPGVLLAALEIAATRPHADRPAKAILELLRHEDVRVRCAAARAMPKLPPKSELLAELCRRARAARGNLAAVTAEALGHSADAPEAEATLVELLQSDDFLVRTAVYRGLGEATRPLQDPVALLGLVRRPGVPVEEAIYGFIALEKTGSIPVAALREALPKLHPLLRLFAARCLVAAGDLAGPRTIVDLLECEEAEGFDDEEADCTREHAHALLEELTGQDYGRTRAAWASWLGDLKKIAPRRLETLPPTDW